MITKKQTFMLGIALVAALVISTCFISAADTTPPVVGIYMSQEAAAGVHNPISYKFSVTAHLFNNESVSYDVVACQINWGDGAGWESVSRGTEGVWYMISHTYATSGVKTISYSCQNDAGLWSSGNVQHLNYDTIDIQIQAPAIEIYLSQNSSDDSHNQDSYNQTIYAHLANNHSLYSVDECQIDWGDGAGWQDIATGTEGIFYTLSYTYSDYGLKTINYRCRNSEGAWSSGTEQHVNFDTINIIDTSSGVIPPAILVYSPQNSGNYLDYVILNASSNQQVNWIYNLNGAGNVSAGTAMNVLYNISSGLINGSNTLIVYGTNANGTDASTITFNFSNSGSLPDTTNPVVTINSPVNGATYNQTNQTLQITATDNAGVDTIWYNWNGTNYTYTAPIIINFTDMQTHTLTAWANDSSGNIGSASISFTVNTSASQSVPDTIPPVITIVSPSNGATFTSTSQLVNISINEAGSIWYSVNGGANQSYTAPLNVNFANGSNTLTVWANDTSGNINSASVTFTINTGSSSSGGSDDDDDDDDDDDSGVLVISSKSPAAKTTSAANNTIVDLSAKKKSEPITLTGKLIWMFIILILILIAAIAFIAATKFGA